MHNGHIRPSATNNNPRPIRHSRPIMPSAYLAYYAQPSPIIKGPLCLVA